MMVVIQLLLGVGSTQIMSMMQHDALSTLQLSQSRKGLGSICDSRCHPAWSAPPDVGGEYSRRVENEGRPTGPSSALEGRPFGSTAADLKLGWLALRRACSQGSTAGDTGM